MTTSTAAIGGLLSGLIAAVLMTPALAQSDGPAKQTPTQPTANDPSVGLPEQPAAMSKNPVALAPDGARSEGTTPTDAAKK